jgi:hypothetical protein
MSINDDMNYVKGVIAGQGLPRSISQQINLYLNGLSGNEDTSTVTDFIKARFLNNHDVFVRNEMSLMQLQLILQLRLLILSQVDIVMLTML